MSICWIRRLPSALSAIFVVVSVAWAEDSPNSDTGAPLTPAQLKVAIANMLRFEAGGTLESAQATCLVGDENSGQRLKSRIVFTRPG
jgi:hypothetical protein